jgi:peroxidase
LGDRFFYDLGTQFTPQQLQEIRKTSMSRVLCDNTQSLTSIQPQAFKLPGTGFTK